MSLQLLTVYTILCVNSYIPFSSLHSHCLIVVFGISLVLVAVLAVVVVALVVCVLGCVCETFNSSSAKVTLV